VSILTDEPCLYLDTSALGRVLTNDPTRGAVLDALEEFEVLTSSQLVRIELLRMAERRGGDVRVAEKLLSRIGLVPLDGAVLEAAETVPPAYVAALDALHLATILRLRENDAVHAVLTYDKDLARACEEHGIHVLSPEA